MAGVKGRSGGKRAGAGRKPAPRPEDAVKAKVQAAKAADAAREAAPEISQIEDPVLRSDGTTRKIGDGPRDPLEFLQDALNDPTAPFKDRIRSAIAAVQYTHTKTHDGGKKKAKQDAAEKAGQGSRFGVRAAPLKVVGGGKP